MRPHGLFPLFALTLVAQDSWPSVWDGLRDLRAPGRYLLAGAGIELGRSWIVQDEVLSAIQISQLGQRTLAGEAGRALQARVQGPGWVLFAPDGRRLAEGQGVPEPRRIREAMTQHGWTWLRDDLKAHLARHPEDGQAWVELAMDLTRQAQQGWMPGTDRWLTMPPERRARFLGELEAAVAGLLKVPEPEQAWLQAPRQSLVFVTMFLGVSEFRKDPQVQQLVDRLAAPFQGLAERDPEDRRIWDFFYSLRAPDESTSFRESAELLERLGGVPGRPWPPLRASVDASYGLWTDPEATRRQAEGWLAANLTPDLVRRLGRDHLRQVLQVWGELRFTALIHLGRVEEARESLLELRTLAGSQWPKVAEAFRDHVLLQPRDEPAEVRLTPAQRQAIRAVLAQPPLPDRPLPPSQPLRVARVGTGDPVAWARLQADPLLDPWEPAELSWKPLSKAEAARFEGHPGWVLLRGEERLASGAGMLTAATLDAALRQHGQPRLEALDAFVKAHPERRDARRERVGLLTTRMPHPRLEAKLIEDLEALEGSFRCPPVSDPALWRPSAKRVSTRLAQRLRHWPFHDEAWGAYIDWSALDPDALRPGALLETLDAWPRLRGNLLPGPLPAVVALEVARKLGAAGRWAELQGWGEALWRKGLQNWLRQSAAIPASERGASVFDRDLAAVREFLAWQDKALRQQGRSPESLRQELEALRPGLGAALLQSPPE